MLVDNSPHNFLQPDITDFAEFLNTDLFNNHSSPLSASSSPSSPSQGILTPPQPAPPPSFHDAQDGTTSFSLFDDDLKFIDSLNSTSYDYLSVANSSLDQGIAGYSMPMDVGFASMNDLNMNMGSGMGLNMSIASISDDALQQMSIDPQLVDTPVSSAPINDFDDDEQEHEGDDEGSSQHSSNASSPSSTADASHTEKDNTDREKLTLTITPVKVGGHGKLRKGTVHSGGIVKKSGISSIYRDKENAISTAVIQSAAHGVALASDSNPTSSTDIVYSPTATSSPSQSKSGSLPKPPTILKASVSKKGKEKDRSAAEEDDDDDVPQDWRPSPEVFAKMTSKEKRQLRNKISARNFRVRRKEYISTLEGDIAERDRLLEVVRSELGSTQSENLALRQEIAALKKVLLEGSGADLPSLNLPPPAPLPVGLNAPTAANTLISSNVSANENAIPTPSSTPNPHQQANATASNAPNPFAPNTQKDLPSSPMPRIGGGFWGGQHQPLGALGGMGAGFTPVHTTLVPEVNVGLMGWGLGNNKKVVGDSTGMNINPLLNAIGADLAKAAGTEKPMKKEEEKEKLADFDAFADTNMFTLKTLDPYRLHLWGKIGVQKQAQHHWVQQQWAQQQWVQQQQQQQQQQTLQTPHQQQHLSGHAASLRPHYFSSPSPKAVASSGLGGTLSALLSGKNTTSTGLFTPPASPKMGATKQRQQQQPNQQSTQQQQREAQAAMLAAVASQTLLKKLGNAFWDAFSGSSSSSTSPLPSNTASRNWDADKVRKVLEGKAVLKVVDLDAPSLPSSPKLAPSSSSSLTKKCDDVKCCSVGDLLEESMRSLTLGKSGTLRK